MKCPHCKETNLVMSERKGIEIDYCPDCRGVWLDRGELDKIIEKSLSESAPAPAQPVQAAPPQPQQHYQQPHHHQKPYYPVDPYTGKPYKRKKSFLEELFD